MCFKSKSNRRTNRSCVVDLQSWSNGWTPHKVIVLNSLLTPRISFYMFCLCVVQVRSYVVEIPLLSKQWFNPILVIVAGSPFLEIQRRSHVECHVCLVVNSTWWQLSLVKVWTSTGGHSFWNPPAMWLKFGCMKWWLCRVCYFHSVQC